MEEVFIGRAGQTAETIEWPKRKAIYTFSHDVPGGEAFEPKVFAAMAEYIDAAKGAGTVEDFTASNGVRVRVSWPDVLGEPEYVDTHPKTYIHPAN